MAASSFVSRKTLALALAAGSAVTALLGGQTAKAQNNSIPPGATICCGGNAYFLPGSGVVSMESPSNNSVGNNGPSAEAANKPATPQIQAPQVTEAQVNHMLLSIYNNKAFAITHPDLVKRSTLDFVRQAYKTGSNTTKALLIACETMNCIAESDQRINSVPKVGKGEVDAAKYDAGLKDLQNHKVIYGDSTLMAYNQAIIDIANVLLQGAKEHGMDMNTYLLKVYLVPSPNDNKWAKATMGAIRRVHSLPDSNATASLKGAPVSAF